MYVCIYLRLGIHNMWLKWKIDDISQQLSIWPMKVASGVQENDLVNKAFWSKKYINETKLQKITRSVIGIKEN